MPPHVRSQRVARIRRVSGADRATRERNYQLGQRIDALAIDGVLRVKLSECPRIKWVLERGRTNAHSLRTCIVGDDMVILRVA